MGMIICVTGSFATFGLVWHIWWLVGIAMLATVAAMIWHGSVRDFERIIPAAEIREDYMRWLDTVAATEPASRESETVPGNLGLAAMHEPVEAAE